ncbi:hypothetical protein HW115_07020 [Verrucomicrobiaceae bacterium N1E253]|uniref:Uncharacterized protein n=1 Tax=Oceaniferula marina TaxID=2748318 RepID=A0A851GD62_9BACT|nr:hypothetical protein [Oceaniferula marina]NWK55356.1 hypothetical protein [Oceaniferula marina]
MKTKLAQFAILTLVCLFSLHTAHAASLSGKQTKGTSAQSQAKLECSPLKISGNKRISAISGNNAGFWIMKDGQVVARFYKKNDPSAVGTVLPAGTYYVYPNLPKGASTATVTLSIN